jgi:hypothetical protein
MVEFDACGGMMRHTAYIETHSVGCALRDTADCDFNPIGAKCTCDLEARLAKGKNRYLTSPTAWFLLEGTDMPRYYRQPDPKLAELIQRIVDDADLITGIPTSFYGSSSS